jgi:hypothetical protein
MPPAGAVAPPLLSIIELPPFGKSMECFLPYVPPSSFPPICSPGFGNALEFLNSYKVITYLFVTPFFRFVGVLSVIIPVVVSDPVVLFAAFYVVFDPLAFVTPVMPANPLFFPPARPAFPLCVFARPKPLLLSSK